MVQGPTAPISSIGKLFFLNNTVKNSFPPPPQKCKSELDGCVIAARNNNEILKVHLKSSDLDVAGRCYTRLTKRDNSLVSYGSSIACIDRFLVEDDLVMAHGVHVEVSNHDLGTSGGTHFLPQMKKIALTTKKVSFRATSIKAVLVKLELNDKLYCCSIPNRYNKDI